MRRARCPARRRGLPSGLLPKRGVVACVAASVPSLGRVRGACRVCRAAPSLSSGVTRPHTADRRRATPPRQRSLTCCSLKTRESAVRRGRRSFAGSAAARPGQWQLQHATEAYRVSGTAFTQLPPLGAALPYVKQVAKIVWPGGSTSLSEPELPVKLHIRPDSAILGVTSNCG